MVGTDDASVAAPPPWLSAGRLKRRHTCFRSNTVSLVDVEGAGGTSAEVARLALPTPDSGPSRPRGVVMTPDGPMPSRGAKTGPGQRCSWWMPSMKLAGRVTNVGNDPTCSISCDPRQ